MPDYPTPPLVSVPWKTAYRIISSRYPPLNVYERYFENAAEQETAALIENLTNPRVQTELGLLRRVPPEERVWGPNASWVMAAFTHIGSPSRFSDGSYGVYYAAESQDTAIAETVYHRESFLRATREPDLELDMRVLRNRIREPLHDLTGEAYRPLLDPEDYGPGQAFGKDLRARQSWGLYYPSVRRAGGSCAGLFRPKAMTLPAQGPHLRYVWDGRRQRITHVLKIQPLSERGASG